MYALSHCFRGSMALAARLEREAGLLILNVRDPDEFIGPLGHLRAANNMRRLNGSPSQLTGLVPTNRPVVIVCKAVRRPSMRPQQLRGRAGVAQAPVLRGGMEMASGWLAGKLKRA